MTMKMCPVCREQFEDELRFCTFDGAPLPGSGLGSPGSSRATADAYPDSIGRAHNGWKTAFFLLLTTVLAGAGIASFLLLGERQSRHSLVTVSQAVMTPPRQAEPPTVSEGETKPGLLSDLSRQELMDRLPNNLLRRFHLGEPGQGTPDDLRVLSGDKGEFVAMVGSGKLEGGRTPVERILILKYEENDFRDATREVLPSLYASGTITGRGAEAKFGEGGNNIVVREPRSSSSIVQPCSSCDGAYQVITLQWKNGRYVESGRAWDNDRYTVFYVVADALEKKKVDNRARPFIESALDPIIAEGFPRNGKDRWTVEWHGDEGAETGAYELGNSFDRIVITVSRVGGQWKAVEIAE
jgi:hypothetical protein